VTVGEEQVSLAVWSNSQDGGEMTDVDTALLNSSLLEYIRHGSGDSKTAYKANGTYWNEASAYVVNADTRTIAVYVWDQRYHFNDQYMADGLSISMSDVSMIEGSASGPQVSVTIQTAWSGSKDAWVSLKWVVRDADTGDQVRVVDEPGSDGLFQPGGSAERSQPFVLPSTGSYEVTVQYTAAETGHDDVKSSPEHLGESWEGPSDATQFTTSGDDGDDTTDGDDSTDDGDDPDDGDGSSGVDPHVSVSNCRVNRPGQFTNAQQELAASITNPTAAALSVTVTWRAGGAVVGEWSDTLDAGAVVDAYVAFDPSATSLSDGEYDVAVEATASLA